MVLVMIQEPPNCPLIYPKYLLRAISPIQGRVGGFL